MMPCRPPTADDSEECRLYRATLDTLAVAVLLVDGDRRVIVSNRATESLFRMADGLALVHDRLSVNRCSERSLLHRLLDLALTPTAALGGLMRVSRPSERQPYVLQISPLDRVTPPLAIVAISDPDTKPVDPETSLMSLYGLTPAQARLARGLLDGETLDTLSRRESVSRNTLRAHLAQLFAKTDTHRQAELVSKLMQDIRAVSLVRR